MIELGSIDRQIRMAIAVKIRALVSAKRQTRGQNRVARKRALFASLSLRPTGNGLALVDRCIGLAATSDKAGATMASDTVRKGGEDDDGSIVCDRAGCR